MRNLKDVSTHFEFGRNWKSYVDNVVTQRSIDAAEQGLERLISRDEIIGKSFLDIGCGSGMTMLAALRLGAGEVHGMDIDPQAIGATHSLLGHFADGSNWSAKTMSVFDTTSLAAGRFDVVHSWGVLHHTGAMWEAIDLARRLVAHGGLFVLALYRKTMFCPVWRLEKRIYSRSPRPIQSVARLIYKATCSIRLVSKGENPWRYSRSYGQSRRGMDWDHDIHDWLGGYPYESVSQQEMLTYARNHDLEVIKVIAEPPFLGVFGSSCDEYVFRKGAR